MHTTIRLVQSQEDLNSVLRLRYRVFTEEMGRTTLANREQQFYTDEFDTERSLIFLAASEANETIATLRLVPLLNGEIWKEPEYQLGTISSHLGLTGLHRGEIGLTDRGCILTSARGGSLYYKLWQALLKEAAAASLRALVGVIDSTNSGLIAYHKRQHWLTYRSSVPFRDIIGNFICRRVQ